MKYKFFNIPVQCPEAAETALNKFLASNAIHSIALRRQFGVQRVVKENNNPGFCLAAARHAKSHGDQRNVLSLLLPNSRAKPEGRVRE